MRGDRRLPAELRAGILILVSLGLAAIFAPWIAPGPEIIRMEEAWSPPGPGHWMGTDGLGRDVAARVVHGARVSLAVGLLAAAIALGIGIPLGAVSGYRGGAADRIVSRLTEAVLCFPTLVLALALLATAPGWLRRFPDAARISLVVGLTGWTAVTRYLRAEFLRLRDSEMVTAARAAGAPERRIVVRHILPAALPPVLVAAAFAVGASILVEAVLTFLGLGVRPPTPTWGGMLEEASQHVRRAWWFALFPGAALFVTVLACNLLGEGLRNVLDSGARRR